MTVFKRELAIMASEMLQAHIPQDQLLREIIQAMDANDVVELLEGIAQNYGLAEEFEQVEAEAKAEELERHSK